MSILVDIILVALIVLGTYLGVRKGLIKSAVSLIGLVAIVIVSYTLRVPLANFLIDTLPFFNFGGMLEGITTLNILIYNLISFVVIFILLYCVLNIVITLTGFIDTLLKFTVIWIIPSKIGGAILGFLETWVFLFLVVFVLSQFNATRGFVEDSSIANVILDNTPIVGNYLYSASGSAQEIYETIEASISDEEVDTEALNLTVLQIQIKYGIISSGKAQELIDTGKIAIEGVMFGKGDNEWLNI